MLTCAAFISVPWRPTTPPPFTEPCVHKRKAFGAYRALIPYIGIPRAVLCPQVEVLRPSLGGPPVPASVAAVCLDLDVALLRVEGGAAGGSDFWGQREEEGQEADKEGSRGHRDGRSRAEGVGLGRRDGGGRRGGDEGEEGEEEEAEDGDGEDEGRVQALVPLLMEEELPHLRQPVVVAGGCGLRAAGCGLGVGGCRLGIGGCGLGISGCG